MRVALVVLIAVAALALVSPVSAKEGVVARLENPAVLRAPSGKSVTLLWTLRAGKHPFGASGIYLRVRGRAGTTTVAEATEMKPGRFSARFVIPRGGVRSIAIGLRGWVSDPRGTRRSDLFFPIVNDPTKR